MTSLTSRLAVGICAIALLTGSANAATYTTGNSTSSYLGISGNGTWMSDSNMGGGGNIALGYAFKPYNTSGFRAEIEGGYHVADGDSGHTGTHYYTAMGNVYYDFGPFSSTRLMPYVGGGVGYASVYHNGQHDAFAYQGMAGLAYTPASAMDNEWYLGYRYLGASDSHDVQANNIELGTRFHF